MHWASSDRRISPSTSFRSLVTVTVSARWEVFGQPAYATILARFVRMFFLTWSTCAHQSCAWPTAQAKAVPKAPAPRNCDLMPCPFLCLHPAWGKRACSTASRARGPCHGTSRARHGAVARTRPHAIMAHCRGTGSAAGPETGPWPCLPPVPARRARFGSPRRPRPRPAPAPPVSSSARRVFSARTSAMAA